MPKRIQMRRDRPWRAENPDAVIVARPSEWGNPFRVGDEGVPDKATAVEKYRDWLIPYTHSTGGLTEYLISESNILDVFCLRGKDLACWCPLDEPCHADVLLELANQTPLDIVS